MADRHHDEEEEQGKQLAVSDTEAGKNETALGDTLNAATEVQEELASWWESPLDSVATSRPLSRL